MSPPDGEAEISLEDSLREQFAAAQQEPEEVAVADVAEEAAAPDDSDTRERDEHGRFKPKAAEAPAEADAAPASDPAPAEAEPILPDPYGLAPQYAAQVVKDKWAELPPELKKEYHDREKLFHRELTKQDEDRVFGRQVREVVKPYESFIRSLGAEPHQAVDYLIKTDYVLRTAAPDQKKAMFLKAARDYGIDLFGEQGAANMQPPVDPMIETMQQRIDRLENEQRSAMQARRDEDQQAINSQIESFASRPENVYFERVKPVMATLLTSGQADSLEKAYDMAVYADPETRALHLAAQQQAEDRKRTAERSAQAARARQAAPSVTGAPGSAVPAALNGSPHATVEDDLRAAFQMHAGRA